MSDREPIILRSADSAHPLFGDERKIDGAGETDGSGQAIISNSVRSNGSHVRLIIIESGKRGCLIEASRALFVDSNAD